MTTDGTRLAPWSAAAALMAGVLWASHGAFEMLQPLGSVTEYQDHLRYSIITDAQGFRLYGLPGPPAILLSTAVIVATVRRGGPGWRRTIATWLAGVAAVLAAAAAVGVAVLLDPPFEAGMNFGRLLVSVAAVVGGGLLRRGAETQRLGTLLRLAGWIGVLALAARVMVNALEFLRGEAAFGISVMFGLAWVVAGLHMLGVIRARPASHGRHDQTVRRTA